MEDSSLCLSQQPIAERVCDRFALPSTDLFGYNTFGGSRESEERVGHFNADSLSEHILTVVTPYWYLSGQSTMGPEIWRPKSGDQLDSEGYFAVLQRDIVQGPRSIHLLESLCAISSNLLHIIYSTTNLKAAAVFDVAMLLTPMDKAIFTAIGSEGSSWFDQFVYGNSHVNLVLIDVPDMCNQLSSSDCVRVLDTVNLFSIKQPEPHSVLKVLNLVMSGRFDGINKLVRKSQIYVAHFATNIIPVFSAQASGDNWLYDSYLTLLEHMNIISEFPVIVGSKLLSIEEGINYCFGEADAP